MATDGGGSEVAVGAGVGSAEIEAEVEALAAREGERGVVGGGVAMGLRAKVRVAGSSVCSRARVS